MYDKIIYKIYYTYICGPDHNKILDTPLLYTVNPILNNIKNLNYELSVGIL